MGSPDDLKTRGESRIGAKKLPWKLAGGLICIHVDPALETWGTIEYYEGKHGIGVLNYPSYNVTFCPYAMLWVLTHVQKPE